MFDRYFKNFMLQLAKKLRENPDQKNAELLWDLLDAYNELSKKYDEMLLKEQEQRNGNEAMHSEEDFDFLKSKLDAFYYTLDSMSKSRDNDPAAYSGWIEEYIPGLLLEKNTAKDLSSLIDSAKALPINERFITKVIPGNAFTLGNGGEKNILADADEDALRIMSEVSPEKRKGNSSSYNAVGDAILDFSNADRRPGGIVKEDYIRLYKSLQNYVNSHDSKPFHDYGKARFNACSKLLADVGLRLADMDPDMRDVIDRDFRINSLRSKVFREYAAEKSKALIKQKEISKDAFAFRAEQIMRGAAQRLEAFSKKSDPSGKKRIEMLKGKLDSFEKRETVLRQFDFDKAPVQKTQPDNIFADISEMKVRKAVGGQMNQRLPLSVKLEDGSKLKGFFTENNSATYDKKYKEMVENLAENIKSLQPSLPEAYSKFFEDLSNVSVDDVYRVLNQIRGKLGSFDDDLSTPFIFDTVAAFNKFTEYLGKLGYKDFAQYNTSLDINEIAKASKGLSDIDGLSEFFHAIVKFADNSYSIYGAKYMNINTAQIQNGGNLNLRNNAMYDMSKLLGHSGLICKSVNMSLKDNGVEKRGNFMLNAKGIPYTKLETGIKLAEGKKAPVVYTASAKRDLSRIQVLDFLCANIDRHAGNFFNDAHFVPDDNGGHIEVRGIQGIDNDMSFGALDGSKTTSRMSKLSEINIIDADQADAIRHMKPEKFENIMRGIGLGKEEIEAGLGRLSAMKNRIKKGEIKIIDGLDAWNKIEIGKQIKHAQDVWAKAFTSECSGKKAPGPSAVSPEEFAAVTEPDNEKIFDISADYAGLQASEQAFYLKDIRTKLSKTENVKSSVSSQSKAYGGSANYKKLCENLDKFINFADELASKQEKNKNGDILPLSDRDMNLLSECHKAIEKLANDYVAKGLEKAKTPGEKLAAAERMNLAKNLAVFCSKNSVAIQDEQTASMKRMAEGFAKQVKNGTRPQTNEVQKGGALSF